MNHRICNTEIWNVLFYCFVSVLFIFSEKTIAQTTVFVETFGNTAPGICDQGTLANGFVTTNGIWTVTNVGVNDSAANEWYISATEPGLTANSCAVPGCHMNSVYTNRSLHVGNVSNSPNAITGIICPTGDCGAVYDPGGFQNAVETNKRVESPSFSMPGQSSNLLVFNYIEYADTPIDSDNVLVYFYDGSSWSSAIADPPRTTPCGTGSVLWEKFSVLLPVLPSAANVKIGFLWKNDNGGAGTNPSFAIDSIAVYNLGIITTITASDTDICTNTCIDFFTDPGGPYSWIFNGATPSTSTQQNPSSICYPNPGTFTVQLINGSDTSTASIKVNPCIPPTADFQADLTVFCERSCVNFSDLSINGATGWSWFFPGGNPSSSASPTPPPICYYTPGFYDVRLIVFNQFGTDTLVKNSYMNVVTCPLPVADFNSTPVQSCPQYCLSFTDISSNGPITSYEWYFPGSLSINSSLANPTVCYSNEGMFDVQLIVSNQYGSDTIIKYSDVNVQFLPNAFASSDTTINFGSSYQLNASGGNNYLWTPASGLDDINIPNPIATPSQTTTYTVSISDGAGCVSFKRVTVTVLKDNAIFIPNTFSPNGDGRNDYLFVRGNNLSDISLIIFDRWGEKIFETTNSLIGWDGTYKGEKVDPGVFTYVITISYSDKKSVSQSGTITLVR